MQPASRPTEGLAAGACEGPGKYVTAGNAEEGRTKGRRRRRIDGSQGRGKARFQLLGRFGRLASAAGCEPDEMGIGPIYAVPKLLKRHFA